MTCKYCDNVVPPERVALGYCWCKETRCVNLGLKESNNIVLVCGHKSIYQPMFINRVATDAGHPKRG